MIWGNFMNIDSDNRLLLKVMAHKVPSGFFTATILFGFGVLFMFLGLILPLHSSFLLPMAYILQGVGLLLFIFKLFF